ncbi:hypothetical protein B0A48_14780 [Cryoendolithus antarcticus]|uniref:Uncharacterized protein n=1 Tax=Cryoendolithus antarcticus TaxID=1507870 RepID=A0A1V8SKH8_9PEZI|nr:hypothetical protein B0A48_14780 [Cryoendolithus antarcticus]
MQAIHPPRGLITQLRGIQASATNVVRNPYRSVSSLTPLPGFRHVNSRHQQMSKIQYRHVGSAPSHIPAVTSIKHHVVLPLKGITVVSLEQAIAAPFCTRQLADLGARVIKVERPEVGDFARGYDDRVNGMASHFVWTNRSKESLALDLKEKKDLATLMKVLERADVLVQNLAPGAADRLGLSFDKLHAKHPELIVCDISGYGQDGPYRNKKAYDLLVQSEAGMLSVTGTESEPAKVGISIADIAAGMYALTNILAAVMQRSKTGKGRRIDISMLESMTEWMSFPLYYTYNGAPGPTPAGASHAAIYPYGPFQCGDGSSVMLGIQNEREWINFCSIVLEDASLKSDLRFMTNSLRSQNRADLKQIIVGAFSKLSSAETVEKLDKAAIANASVNDMKGVWDHPQLRARERWTTVDTPVGPVPALLPPGANPTDVRMDAVPDVGQHNQKILAEFGIDS